MMQRSAETTGRIHHGASYGTTGNGRSIGDLIGDLAEETRTLVQQEVRLAGAEMSEKAEKIGKNSAKAAAGGMVLYAGLLVVLIGLSIGLAVLLAETVMTMATASWVAPLVVGAVVGFTGYAMMQHGIQKIRDTDLTPRKTTRSIRETTRWMHEKVM